MKISNKRAFYDYEIGERIEAGINLNGAEVKAVKSEHADLTGSFVRIMGSEAYLVNAKIFPLPYARPQDYDESRTRKLLLHKKEIISLKNRAEGSNMTLVPISLYDKNGLIKLEVGIGKGKRKFDKKEAKKRADIARDIEQELAS
jgi:SsrA-binding protein